MGVEMAVCTYGSVTKIDLCVDWGGGAGGGGEGGGAVREIKNSKEV